MEIIDIIPTGRENAASRFSLRVLCNKYNIVKTDRAMRQKIEDARKTEPIIHNTKGYFKPDYRHEADMLELHQYIMKEKSRANSIYQNVKVAEYYYNKWTALR